MALQSVFAQGPHFGSGHTSDPNQDENHEVDLQVYDKYDPTLHGPAHAGKTK